MSADLSIIIVNFNSGEYLAGCLESLKSQDLGSRRVEYLVVDCASTVDQESWLTDARQRGARVLPLDVNPGYAGGCNYGYTLSSGEFVFFLNADVAAREGCIEPLVTLLSERRDVGMVEPRTYLDTGCRFLIPEIHELTRIELLAGGAGRLSGGLAQKMSLRRVRRTLPVWQAEEPIAMKTLSGAFMGMRREVVDAVGGLDESYPLFYEDSDLFLRIRQMGLLLVQQPKSRAIHFGHRSVATVWNEAMAKHMTSRELYIRKHLGVGTAFFNRCMERAIAWINKIHTPRPCRDGTNLGARNVPPALAWEGSGGPHLVELALDPFFHLAAAAFCSGNEIILQQNTWDSLNDGEYFFRALDLQGLIERARWKVTKTQASSTS